VVRFIVIWHDTPTDTEEFDQHYRDVHIPLASKMLGLRRYSLSKNLRSVRGEAPYAVAELEWDDPETMRTDMQSDAGKATGEDVDFMRQWSPGVQSMTYELEDVRARTRQ
jgi:uncharacterized protein (TIGR02118 family)